MLLVLKELKLCGGLFPAITVPLGLIPLARLKQKISGNCWEFFSERARIGYTGYIHFCRDPPLKGRRLKVSLSGAEEMALCFKSAGCRSRGSVFDSQHPPGS